MSANIESMMYAGKAPWHEQGTYVGDKNVTAEEAIAAAGLDWDVAKVPVMVTRVGVGDKKIRDVVPGHFGIQRQTDGKVFGIAKTEYRVVQNRDAFKFFDAIIGGGAAIYHTAGALGDGARVWILAQLPGEVVLDKATGDVIKPFVLLATSHQPGQSLRVISTDIRVVCSNTHQMALKAAGKSGFRTSHTGDLMSKAVTAREVLNLNEAHLGMLQQQVNALIAESMDMAEVEGFAKVLVGAAKDAEMGDLTPPMRKVVIKVSELFTGGIGQVGAVAGTRMAALNAVTQLVDHHGDLVLAKKGGERIVEAAWFGKGAAMKQRAWDLLMDGLWTPGDGGE